MAVNNRRNTVFEVTQVLKKYVLPPVVNTNLAKAAETKPFLLYLRAGWQFIASSRNSGHIRLFQNGRSNHTKKQTH